MGVVRPVGHEQRLSLIEHLDELRTRLIYCIVAFVVCFSICYWQNHWLLQTVNKPLQSTQNLDGKKRSKDPLEESARFAIRSGAAQKQAVAAFRSASRLYGALAADPSLSARQRTLARDAAAQNAAAAATQAVAAAAVPTNRGRQPITLGVTEPFVTTFTVAAYAAILLSLPIILWQAYAFVLPAFSPAERRVALPLMLMVPFLFLCGVAFGYFVALPRAINFLQNFNDQSFDILIRAADYYKFSVVLLLVIGLLFQIPVGVLAVTRLGVISARQLGRNRGYVILALAIVAAVATPTPDGAARGPLRAQHPPRPLLRAPRRAPRRARVGRGRRSRRILTVMLFDLRGRGRRRTVQAIYLSLAILMGGGLVLFGIGGATNGGLIDAIQGNGSTTSASDTFKKRVDALDKRVQANPRDSRAWAELSDVRFQSATSGANYDQVNGIYTAKGKAVLRTAAAAWQRHLALSPEKPNTKVAKDMVQAYGAAGLRNYPEAVKALEFVIDATPNPTFQTYAQLAVLSHGAKQTRKEKLAADKAAELAPKGQAKTVRDQIKAAEQQLDGLATAGQPNGQ
jgi:sec-independent protein translocase protein TatC